MSALFRPRLAFMLVAAVLLTLAFAALPRTANAEIHQITTGELNWGVKESWRNYVGGGLVTEGASVNEDGTYKFPVKSGTFDDETNTTELDLAGSVWFRSWWEYIEPGKWALDTTIKDLKVVINPTEQILRGTIIGYSQDDPGGELHENVDVVVAQIDIADSQSITFDNGQSVYSGLATMAAAGLGLYGPGTALDRLSFSYTGPGGLPDTGEKLGVPGSVSLEEAQRHVSDFPKETVSRSNARVFVGEGGEQLDFVEIKNAHNANTVMRFSRFDAETLESVGTPASFTDFPVHNGNRFFGRFFRIVQLPESGDLVFLRGGMGDDDFGNWLMQASWNDASGTYSFSKVGELPDTYINQATNNPVTPQVGDMVYNDVLDEVQILAQNPDSTDLYDQSLVYRFSEGENGWERQESVLRAPDTGQWAGATEMNTPWGYQVSGSAVTETQDLAVARDGSLIVPSKTGYMGTPDPEDPDSTVRTNLPSAQIKFSGAAATTRYIPGTIVGIHPFADYYYGWTSASTSYDGSVLIHNSQWGLESFIRVDIVEGDAQVTGPIYYSEDDYAPYGMATMGRLITADPARGRDWVVSVSDNDGLFLNAFHQVNGEDVMFSRHRQSELSSVGAFGAPPVVHPNGDLYLVVNERTSGPLTIVRMDFRGEFASFDETPQVREVELDANETSETVSFTSTIEGGSPAPTRQWQVKRAGESRFVDIEGETGETLEVTADRKANSSLFRAFYDSEAGQIATEPASLTVRYAPSVVNEPADANVTAGDPATFVVMPTGNPMPDVVWQVRLNGVWQNIDLDNGQFEVSGEHGGFLAVNDTNTEMDGLKFRARLRNQITPGSAESKTVFSREVTLRVSQAETSRVYFDSASSSADWGVANRYRCYVTGNIARGWIETEGGATQIPGTTPTGGLCAGTNAATGKPWGTGGEAFRFGLGAALFPEVGDEPLTPVYDPESRRLRVDLAGKVRFLGHTYHAPGDTTPLLKTELSNLRIEADLGSGEGFIYVDAAGTNMDSDVPLKVDGVKIAYFDASAIALNPVDGRITIANVPTFLHQQGVQIFGNYPVNEPMDPLTLDLKVGEKPVRPDEPTPPVEEIVAPAVKKLGFKALKGNTAVVRINCPVAATSGCRVTAPKKATLVARGKVNGKVRTQLKQGARINVPAKIGAGKTATVKLKLTGKQRRILKNRKVIARFRLVSTSVGGKADRRNVTLRGKVR